MRETLRKSIIQELSRKDCFKQLGDSHNEAQIKSPTRTHRLNEGSFEHWSSDIFPVEPVALSI